MKPVLLLYFGILFSSAHDLVAATGRFVQVDEQVVGVVKKQLADGSASGATRKIYAELLAAADTRLLSPRLSVVDKTISPPGDSKHDYLSLSRYWWPNPDTDDGMPWIRKDGVTNPDSQSDAIDRLRLEHTFLATTAYGIQ